MASKTSEVSIPRASHHYFTSMQNLLLTAETACFLGKHLVRYLGKDVADFPSLGKIDDHTMNYFAFYNLGSAAKSIYTTCSVLLGGALVLRGETPRNLRIQRKGDSPRADNDYIGVKTWMTYKTVSSLFKTVSSFLLVHEALKRISSVKTSFSPTIRAIGAGLGAAGFAIDIIDKQRAIYAHEKDVSDENVPSDAKINGSRIMSDCNLHRDMTQAARRYDQLFFILIIGIKLIGATRALDMVDHPGLIGRVSRFVIDNTENCYGFLSTAMTATGLIQHALYGATIQQLEQHNVNK